MFAALFSWMPPALKVLVFAAVSFFGFIVVVILVRFFIGFVSDAVALLKSFIPFI
mgnify:CR=1 FL=1